MGQDGSLRKSEILTQQDLSYPSENGYLGPYSWHWHFLFAFNRARGFYNLAFLVVVSVFLIFFGGWGPRKEGTKYVIYWNVLIFTEGIGSLVLLDKCISLPSICKHQSVKALQALHLVLHEGIDMWSEGLVLGDKLFAPYMPSDLARPPVYTCPIGYCCCRAWTRLHIIQLEDKLSAWGIPSVILNIFSPD